MLDFVREYYGQVLANSADLKTDACCTLEAPGPAVRAALARVHPAVRERYYGCGLLVPEAATGLKVLDLGCGAGRDVYLLSQLVGPNGTVVGVDMTAEQLAVASRYRDHHARQFGFANVSFLEGYIERLHELPLEPASFDLIVSNCVMNLSPHKAAVLEGAHGLLRPGGEFFFADVYADRRLDESLTRDPILVGECLGGALYWRDFLQLAKAAGFADPRLVDDRPIAVADPELAVKLGAAQFFSATYRLFKLPELEPGAEDYGHTATYRGTIANHADAIKLDKDHMFPTGERLAVSGNTFAMLGNTRFAPHFELTGDRSEHFGTFPTAHSGIPFDAHAAPDSKARSCC